MRSTTPAGKIQIISRICISYTISHYFELRNSSIPVSWFRKISSKNQKRYPKRAMLIQRFQNKAKFLEEVGPSKHVSLLNEFIFDSFDMRTFKIRWWNGNSQANTVPSDTVSYDQRDFASPFIRTATNLLRKQLRKFKICIN